MHQISQWTPLKAIQHIEAIPSMHNTCTHAEGSQVKTEKNYTFTINYTTCFIHTLTHIYTQDSSCTTHISLPDCTVHCTTFKPGTHTTTKWLSPKMLSVFSSQNWQLLQYLNCLQQVLCSRTERYCPSMRLTVHNAVKNYGSNIGGLMATNIRPYILRAICLDWVENISK